MKNTVFLLLLMVSVGLTEDAKKESEKDFRGWSEGDFVEIRLSGAPQEGDSRWPYGPVRWTFWWAKIDKISKTHLRIKLFYEIYSLDRRDWDRVRGDPEAMKKVLTNVGGRLVNVHKGSVLDMKEWQRGTYPLRPASLWDILR